MSYFKKASFVLVAFVGVQVFGGEKLKPFDPNQLKDIPPKEMGKFYKELHREQREKELEKARRYALIAGGTGVLGGAMGLYSIALDSSIRAKPYISRKPVYVSRATRFLMNSGPLVGIGIAGAGALAATALGLKYYNNKYLTPERSRAFKERTPEYNYWTLGDSY